MKLKVHADGCKKCILRLYDGTIEDAFHGILMYAMMLIST